MPLHDGVTAEALGKSFVNEHSPANLRQRHISSDPVSSKGVAMPNTARNAVSNDIIAASGLNPLKAARETRGYTIEELSLTCGLAVGEIIDIEDGKDADPAKLRRIATALQMPEEELITVPAAENRPVQQ
jgi:hypothetical protein